MVNPALGARGESRAVRYCANRIRMVQSMINPGTFRWDFGTGTFRPVVPKCTGIWYAKVLSLSHLRPIYNNYILLLVYNHCYFSLLFIFSNFQTIYFSIKLFLALKVRFKRKLLKKWQKKRIHVPTTHLNWKTVNHQQFPGTNFQFYSYFRN